jgi:hypothetical protein
MAALGAMSLALACGAKSSKTTAANASAKSSACCASKSSATATTAVVSSSKGACTAEMAAACTPEMMAQCATMKAANHKQSGKAVSMDCCMGKTSASNAVAAKSAAGDHCGMGAKTTAMAAGSSCGAHGSTMAAMDCNTCEDWAMCETQVRASGARSQVVALKNGVMIVYTAEGAEHVRAIQSAVARRGESMTKGTKVAKDAKLCGDCRQLRGAMASGKLQREVVNIEKGAMDLLTSNDRAIVQRIHTMTGAQLAAH